VVNGTPQRRRRLGEVLRENQHISHEQLEQAIEEQRKSSGLLGELLLQRGLVAKIDLVAALEEVTRFRYIDCRFSTVDHSILKLIPRSAAQRYSVLPLAREGSKLVTAMAEPQNLRILDELRFISGLEISPRMGFRSEINAAIENFYPKVTERVLVDEIAVPLLGQVDIGDVEFFSQPTEQDADSEAVQAELNQKGITPAVRLVSAIVSAAAQKKASDIHIEPQALGVVIRIRVDGVLRELARVPSELQNSLISRVKILSNMDISERRAPQDGRFLVQIGTRHVDLRVSSLPTHYGEKIVMRLLDPAATRVEFVDLGFSIEQSKILQEVIKLPQGMLLVTGPTGSGKSTTLYACLNAIKSPETNICTVEDPVEYKLSGVNQVQINLKAGLTFASCLRSLLRQDPNVIMVGEIRDTETAEIALQASQTGHFVLSTMHTNDSVAAVTRLLDLKVPGFLIASSVTAVIAQRLVRKLCECRDERAVTPEFTSRLIAADVLNVPAKMYVPTGCNICDNTGYKGRVGIYEVLVFDEQLRAHVRGGIRDDEMRNLARSSGLRMMQEDAIEKVRRGITTLEEVTRVMPFGRQASARCTCGRVLAPNFLFCPYCGVPSASLTAPQPAASQPAALQSAAPQVYSAKGSA
jgi:type IV pilus assembly protein PilB